MGEVLCSRVRELRKKKGWTLEEMSAACGVSRSMLSEIERGRANPTLAVAYRIAQAFGMSLGELVELPNATHRLDVIRADDHSYHFPLGPLLPHPHAFAVAPGEVGRVLRDRAPRRRGVEERAALRGRQELLTVQQGAVRVRSGDESVELATGDSAHYPADVPHAIENLGRDDAVLFLVVTYLRD